MEQFVVSARKYRPQTFKDVVGQQAITNTLVNAIENNHLAQALLFTGPRGVGKTTCARILAKKINQDASEIQDEDFAFNIFELDAASNNSVDDIRNLIDQVRIPPQVGKYKVYIIDEVHMLSQAAFNAFLKTLEEPPKHAIFILATTEKHKIIPTILSRCQIFDFKRITVGDAKNYLKYIAEQEGVEAEDDALHIIAQKADGAMRDALSIYDRVVSFSGKNLTRQAVTENLNVLDYDTYLTATDLILENEIPQLLLYFNEVLAQGFDGQHFIAGLASHFRDLLVCKDQRTISLLEVGENTKQKYFEQAQQASPLLLVRAIDLANQCDQQYKSSRNQRLLVELCLMQLASLTAVEEKKKDSGFILPPDQVRNPSTDNGRVKTIQPSHSTQPVEETQAPPANPAVSQSQPATTPIDDLDLDKEPETPVTNKPVAQDSTKPLIPEAQQPDDPRDRAEISETVPARHPQKDSQNGVTITETSTAQQSPAPNNELEPVEIQNKPVRKQVSGLSLKSIEKKRELEANKMKRQHQAAEERDEVFTETQMRSAWKEFVDKLNQKGEKIVASVMETDTPVLEDKTIILEMPNDSMKQELEKIQHPLMMFLKEKLQNTNIRLLIKVNETAAKKYAFTPQEKYEKLRQKNPLLDKLRTTFDLDI